MVKVTGTDRIQRRLRMMAPETKKEVRAGLKIAAEHIADNQRRFVPVLTGALKESIAVTFGDEDRIKYSQGIGGNHELSIRISAGNTKVRYAHLVEFGARPHIAGGLFKGAQHPGNVAQPFFWPGYRLGKKRVKRIISAAVRKAAKNAVARG